MNINFDDNFKFVKIIIAITILVGAILGGVGWIIWDDYKIFSGVFLGSILGALNFFLIYINLLVNLNPQNKKIMTQKIVGNYYIRMAILFVLMIGVYKLGFVNIFAILGGFILYQLVIYGYHARFLIFKEGVK